jgi:phospholipase C
MHWKLLVAGAFAFGLLAAVAGMTRQARSAPAYRLIASPIEHVVIVFQENHSFDDVLGKLCVLDSRCDGVTTGRLHDGRTIPLTQEPDLVPNVDHTVPGQATAIDGGAMDGFDLINGCTSDRGYACYAQFDPSQIPNLAAFARAFVVSDRTFEFAQTPSWAGHMVLASATLDGFRGDIPKKSKYTPSVGPGWGCDSNLDDAWWNRTKYVLQPSCVPDADGHGPYRASRVLYVPTIMDRLDQAGLSWRIYGAGRGAGYGRSICPTFYECLGSNQRRNMATAEAAVTDASAGTLPAFSIVLPDHPNSQHNNRSMAMGDNWIGQVVGAVMNGSDWSSTALFISYDDCGCFYDHVPPPPSLPSAGVRVPMVIVSPYAKPGYTDSADATFVSMLAYTEHIFGLPPLNENDATAYDYALSFDYTQPPLEPIPVTTTQLPAQERAWIAAHPGDPDDPT